MYVVSKENIPALKTHTLKYSGLKGQNVCNLLSKWSKNNCVRVCVFRDWGKECDKNAKN